MAFVSEMHDQYLSVNHFPIVGSVIKHPTFKNRRRVDMNILAAERERSIGVDRSQWGLPTPNLEASLISLSKYAKFHKVLDEKQVQCLNVAFEWMEREFGVYMRNSRVKEYDEVVQGLDLQTSPGYPWARKFPTKKLLLEGFSSFREWCLQDWERLKDHDFYCLFGNSLKEEVRPKAKIDLNKIRTFTAGPIEMTIHGNRLFEDMNEKFYNSALLSPSVVGFTPYYGGWNRLYNKLVQHPNGFALDETEYDSSLRDYLMWAVGSFRYKMLAAEFQTEDIKARVQQYYKNLNYSWIVTAEGVIIMKQGGNPSGSVNTISDNTLILFILLSYAWLMLAPAGLCDFVSMKKNTAFALCGDDNTWTVSDLCLPFFNPTNISQVWTAIGVTTTADSYLPSAPKDLSFLSAETVFHKGFAVPLMDRSKVLTSLLYSEHGSDPIMSLTRAGNMYQVLWTDKEARYYLSELIDWLIKTYDPIMSMNSEWQIARSSVPTDRVVERLYLGLECGMQERSNSHIKLQMQSAKKNGNGGATQNGKRKRNRRRRLRQRQNRRMRGGAAKRPNFRGAQRGMFRKTIAPIAASTFSRNGAPSIRSVGANSIVSHREFVQDVTLYDAFTVNRFQINPGLSSVFPWLSTIAKNYESYQFQFLRFLYKTRAATTVTGTVMMAVDFDAGDGDPTSKAVMLQFKNAIAGAPWQDLNMPCRMQDVKKMKERYVRSGNIPGGQDIKTYDVGALFFASVAANETEDIGELWVEYRVSLRTPQLETANVYNYTSAKAVVTADQSITSTVATVVDFEVDSNNIGISTESDGSFLLQAGSYKFQGEVIITDATLTAATVTYILDGGTPVQIAAPTIATGITQQTIPFTFVVTSTSAMGVDIVVTLTGTTLVVDADSFVVINTC